MFTGKSSLKEHWDAVSGLPNKKHPLHKELVIYLKKKLLVAEAEVLELEKNDQHFTADNIKQALRRGKGRNNVFDFFDNIIDGYKKSGEIGNMTSFKSCKNALLKFLDGNRNLDFRDITPSFLTRYEQYHRGRGMMDSTIHFYIKNIKNLFVYAMKEKIVKADNDTFLLYDLSKFRIEPNHRAIGKDNIEAIFNYKAEELTNQSHALNFFKFSYYTWGMNMVDIAKLKWKNIENGRIVYIRSKNKRRHNISILPPVQAILDYYNEGRVPYPEDYIFPILDDKIYKTPLQQKYRQQYATKYTNKEIKKIAKELGMNFNLTTYMARHTFATNLQLMKIETGKIQQMLGHSSETTTQGYLDGIKNDDLDQAAMVLIAW